MIIYTMVLINTMVYKYRGLHYYLLLSERPTENYVQIRSRPYAMQAINRLYLALLIELGL